MASYPWRSRGRVDDSRNRPRAFDARLLTFPIELARHHLPLEDQLGIPVIDPTQAASILADAGLGIAVVDPFTAQFVRTKDMTTRPFKPDVSVTGAAIVRQGRSLSRLTSAFIDEVRGVLSAPPPGGIGMPKGA